MSQESPDFSHGECQDYLISPLVEAIVWMAGIDSFEPGMEDVFDDILSPCEDCDETEEQEESDRKSEEE